MIREMVDRLAHEPTDYPSDGHAARLARVILDELVEMPRERFNLPVSSHPKNRAIANALTIEPSDRSTSAESAKRVAMSERSLTRLMIRETGLTFGRWQQQLHLVVALRGLASGAKVQNVATELGYNSVNAFITLFKKALGSCFRNNLFFLHGCKRLTRTLNFVQNLLMLSRVSPSAASRIMRARRPSR